jgi:hypothetical protein
MSFMPLAIAAKVLPMVFVEPLRFEIDLRVLVTNPKPEEKTHGDQGTAAIQDLHSGRAAGKYAIAFRKRPILSSVLVP